MKWVLLLGIFIAGCAYVNGPGTATVNIDRKVEIDSTIKKDGNRK